MMQNTKSNENSKNSTVIEIKVTDDNPSSETVVSGQNQAQNLQNQLQNTSTSVPVLDHPSLTAALLQAAKDLQANANISPNSVQSNEQQSSSLIHQQNGMVNNNPGMPHNLAQLQAALNAGSNSTKC